MMKITRGWLLAACMVAAVVSNAVSATVLGFYGANNTVSVKPKHKYKVYANKKNKRKYNAHQHSKNQHKHRADYENI